MLQNIHNDLSYYLLLLFNSVVQGGLAQNFADVEVNVVDCPDLTKSPFNLAAPGEGGFFFTIFENSRTLYF